MAEQAQHLHGPHRELSGGANEDEQRQHLAGARHQHQPGEHRNPAERMARAAALRRLRSLRPAARRSGTQLSDAPREVRALRGAARQEIGAARLKLRQTAHGSLPTPRRSSRNCWSDPSRTPGCLPSVRAPSAAHTPASARKARVPPRRPRVRCVSQSATTSAVTAKATASSAQATAAMSHTSTRTSRSEEHTSELQSHSDLVCRLLLEKKKIQNDVGGGRPYLVLDD